MRELAERWSPERAAGHAGVEEETIARLARDLAAAPRAVVYGRVGICQQQTGSLTHWLINVLNTVTGNMDSVGGAMFPTPAVDLTGLVDRLAGSPHRGRYTQRVSGLPEFADELPVAGLADELSTPGEGQVRGMLIYAGNPVLSTPGGARLDEAMEGLEWCVAVDMYVTETTRHADVILPPLAQLERDDLDIVFPAFSVRNQIRYNPAAVQGPSDGKDDWEILSELTTRIGRGAIGTARNLALRLARPARELRPADRPRPAHRSRTDGCARAARSTSARSSGRATASISARSSRASSRACGRTASASGSRRPC